MSGEVRELREVATWSDSADVVVVGLGAAGAAVALEASGTGAETLVLERAAAGGGTSAMSGGVLYLGGGTALQKACGFEDSCEAMYAYLMASCGESPDEAKVRLYCEGSCEHYAWLVAQGVPFKPVFYDGCSGEPPTDDGLVWSGSERAHPFCELARPAPRGHVPQLEHQAGPMLMRALLAAVAASSARVAAGQRCTALVRDDSGGVVGVIASGERAIRARRGVVLTTGGFIQRRDARGPPTPFDAMQVPGGRRGGRRQWDPLGDGGRGGHRPHERRLDLPARDAALGPPARDSGELPGTTVRERGCLLRMLG